MNKSKKLMDRWRSITDTVMRFPITVLFLFAAMINNAVAIIMQTDDFVLELSTTLLVGAMLYAVFQVLYERFFDKNALRIVFMGATVVLSIVYYLLINNNRWDIEFTIRTEVLLFMLLIAFLWIPVIKSKYDFNRSFMAAFKAFFTAALFTGVLFLGIAIIIATTDMLIINIDSDAYAHAANIVFVFLAPIYFFSLIPYYPGNRSANTEIDTTEQMDQPAEIELQSQETAVWQKQEVVAVGQPSQEELTRKLTSPGKFLVALISFVIIPITALLTIILLLYILLNITGEFWTDNLIEPLLVSFSITVITVYLLAGTLQNAASKYFRMIFPKILVPVVLFQTISSILKINETGITYGRYYVIMFGLFATAAGIIFCIVPARKNGLIAPILIVLSLISIVPPVDAFTVSRMNQTGRLERALKRNDMFDGETITPNADIPEKDKNIIRSSFQYLNRLDYSKSIKWLKDYGDNYNFEKTFGFSQYEYNKGYYHNVFLSLNENTLIPVEGYDYMLYTSIYGVSDKFEMSKNELSQYVTDGRTYSLNYSGKTAEEQELLLREGENELIRFPISNIFNKYKDFEGDAILDIGELTFTEENSKAKITIIATSISINEWEDGSNQYADVYILVDIK